MTDLPVLAVLDDVLAALRGTGAGVLIAPPGAGKTTAVAPALLDQEWCSGTILLTSPRRVAARAAAERMAELIGEKPGQTVGYMTRLDSKLSAQTRIVVMTEAILVNRLLDDPELSGISAILFDEAHERHLDSDLALALALETRMVLREDLRVLVMSATIDGGRFGRLLGEDAPVVESVGKAYPLEMRWLGSSPAARTEDAMCQAIMTAWRETDRDILAFLPGVREIERTRERLVDRLSDVPILPLHGQVDPAAQREAIRLDRDGRRRIVLATSIAESSITLDGVGVVVDSGLSRHAEFDKAAGTTHLVTRRASQASAAQRAGRAARQGPGIAYRLWEEHGHAGRPAFDEPEIVTADLAGLSLALASRGTGDPTQLPWLDLPPASSLDAARRQLTSLEALDSAGKITAFGKAMAAMPMDPAQAAMVLHGSRAGQSDRAAQIALLVQERRLGGAEEDLIARLHRWDADRGSRAAASRKLAAGWARRADKLVAEQAAEVRGDAISPALFLALARPDFIARRRPNSQSEWISAGGRGFVIDPTSPLARNEWIVIADAQGRASGSVVTSGAALERDDIERHLAHRIQSQSILRWNAREERVEARVERRLGEIVIASGPDPSPNTGDIVDILVDKAVEKMSIVLPDNLLARARYAEIDALTPEKLRDTARFWLAPFLEGRRDIGLPQGQIADALLNSLDWEQRKRMDNAAPKEFVSPAGTHHAIDYTGEDAPCVEVRVQALFGLDRHPKVGSTPLLIKLTSPAGRPVQATRDLPGFWRGSWADVRKEMKGRYPKHRWPEEPWTERPSLKTKNAFSREAS
ncbi:ATP-dependent helicase HrpB [Porphyrobacter algicida]|uniref:RNA helicase n=1 Tax=Qipengyuania algicida TaxID=1836209 RepID=A0A845AEW7_9SPHN|nr:ATP-dependent helicase HrpB [Qipengyuania algicida]MXP27345.1 ATP-dependent helicase HrpB [Qipengyuania algicida]